jgi:hypothetical protein
MAKFPEEIKMSKKLQILSLSSAAILVLTLITVPEIFGQSPIAGNSANNLPAKSGNVSRPDASNRQTTDLAKELGNFSIILPSKSDGDSTATNSNTNENANTSPTPIPPQPGASQFNDRAIARDRNAPRRDNLNAIKIVDHVNGLIGGFEQGAGFGFGLELTISTGKELKGYEVYGRALISTRFYRKAEVGARLGNDTTRGDVWFGYLRRTRDNFFGIGPRTSDLLETNYQIEQRSYNGLFAHKISEKMEIGLYGRLSNTGSFRGEDDKDALIDTLFSGDPATTPVTRFLPGFQTNAKLFNYGVFAELDLRNKESGLVKGAYFYGRFGSTDGLDNGNAFSDYGWTEVELDGRVYIPIFGDKTSLALRGYTELKDPKRGSQIPFYDLAWLGGRNYVRGFDTYRFRANNTVIYSGEVRQTVWAQNDRNTRGLDIFVFGDAGQVWGDNRSKINPAILANDKFDSQNWRFGIGGGVQYRLSKDLALRIELATTNERKKAYFSQRPGF